jgi:gamma-glutamyl-gamma-aminobutyrate hydrolase PuuD
MTYYIPTSDKWPLHIKPYLDLMKKAGYFREEDSNNADFLLLPGGADIGMRNGRDEYEIYLYKRFRELGKPIIGICRGLQLMIYLNESGNAFIDHIPDYAKEIIHTTISGDWQGQSSWHTTQNGLLVNSRHHQGVKEKEVTQYEVIDVTTDGIVEAIENKETKEFAVQWHPEHMEMNDTPAQEWFICKLQKIIQ